MREFIKSMTSYTSAVSLFGLQQMVNIVRPGKATESFNNVTKATEAELSDSVRATFRAGDNLQRALVDVTFGVMTLGMFDRSDSRATTDEGGQAAAGMPGQGGRVVNRAADAVGQGLQAATQTFGVLVQSLTGMASGSGCCGDSKSQPSGWGPVPPPTGTQD